VKVKELIAKLQAQDPELEVYAEGCDCTGEAVGISVYEYENYATKAKQMRLIIRRDSGDMEYGEWKIL
jgi:hypothetical protein